MSTLTGYLTDLVNQKNLLVDNLVTMGVSATHDEKLNTLVPKVLEIKVGGSDEAPELYPVIIALDKTNLNIQDTSNGEFGDGYIIYYNGTQLTKFKNSENEINVNLNDYTFPAISDYNISVSVYDDDGFKNSALSNSVLYKMPGYYIVNNTDIVFQVDYEVIPDNWNKNAYAYKLI